MADQHQPTTTDFLSDMVEVLRELNEAQRRTGETVDEILELLKEERQAAQIRRTWRGRGG